ncbi:hypothetical protein T02_400 [Trichinella nativa]|uniref:Uncharacterized protein n=1 Tax=Trichinella nativa TaxID=6335 RepID=A0A0V1LQ40_9BILA|nr:hypothetical protein T02_400 [Trichinella nativa]
MFSTLKLSFEIEINQIYLSTMIKPKFNEVEFATKEYRHYVMAVNFRVKMPLGEVDFVLLTPNKPVCVTW